MSLLLNLLLYAVVGGGEWYLALRRTLACARGERALMIGIVFIENLLGLWVMSNFVRANDWFLGFSYALGGAFGAFLVDFKKEKPQPAPEAVPAHSVAYAKQESEPALSLQRPAA